MAVSRDLEAPAVLNDPTADDATIEKKEYADGTPANDPFGNEECGEVKYRVMSWWQCGTLMVAENISLGILSLPSAVATLGIVPAVILLLGLSAISWYTGYIMGQFKLRFPQIHSMGDAGELLLGRFGRELFGIGQLLFLIFLMASHILTFTVVFNTITNHGTCTIVFGVVGLVVSFIGALPRTMGKVYWMSMASCISIVTATVVTMIAIGVQAPDHVHVDATTEVSFQDAFLAVTNIIFAYSRGHQLVHRDCDGHLPLCRPDVASPALSSAGPLMKKVAYGLAIPTVVIAGVVFGHVACKYIYVRIFRGSAHMHQNSFLAIGSWVAIALSVWVVAWVIAESIPVFNELLSLISSLFGSWFSYGLPAIFWLVMNKGRWFSTRSKICLTIVNFLILAFACALCGMGLYVSGKSIHDSSSKASWTCKNNAT
ncbi:putative amino acid transporter [Aspergillus novofumigatus IBT 16806]|uniref:Putative amino acid transporter n=1 Tax=Aspergillus novofumigatus (strain IBT 16806) TaxID=1392255 RepID=A0A2I1BXB0_ASPN1|nr:putative amino acid transporter [Aspergillus novofumigatus IBT 16806]PKX90008.1 putative amino acid transporter [Aspergillus novofumigatus IBT 16806]